MLDNKDLVQKITNDVNKLQDKIENRQLYNIRNFVIRMLLRSGIVIDYALPFILSAVVIGYLQSSKGNTPFHRDEVIEKASVETIDTSSGIHLERKSYDFNYNNELVEHSTGWIVNDEGLYERTVTSYKLNDNVDINDTEKILSMTKEEIDKALVITDVNTIKKNTLTPEDTIYNSDAIIVINHSESDEMVTTNLEGKDVNAFLSTIYLIIVFCCGKGTMHIENLFVKTQIRDIFKQYVYLFRPIKKEELETMRKILEIKQENLAMLDSNIKTIDKEEGYSYRLRKL